MKAGVFEAMVDDLREVLRLLSGRNEQPSAIILDSRTVQSTVESGHRAGYDGGKRKKGSKVHMAVDTLGQLLALYETSTTLPNFLEHLVRFEKRKEQHWEKSSR